MTHEPTDVLERLLEALNAHDVDAMAACFAVDYVNETPAHPQRSFRGREQVHRNWRQIFSGVHDLAASIVGSTVDGDVVWTEWEMRGRRRDGTPFLMCGPVIFVVGGAQIESARFYLEPVEDTGDVDEHTALLAGTAHEAVLGVSS